MYARSNNYLSSKSLTARYVIALSFIAMIITLSTYSFQRVIADQQYSSNTIARASADRFLLEQINIKGEAIFLMGKRYKESATR